MFVGGMPIELPVTGSVVNDLLEGETMRRLMTTAIAIALLAPGIASASAPITRVDVCLGDTHVIEAREGHSFTYTEPKYAYAWPSMAQEVLASQGAIDTWADSGSPMPVAWWLSPNRELLEQSGAPTSDPKAEAWANPKVYVKSLATSRSRAVFNAHAVGAHKLQLWQRNNLTGDVKKLSFAVFVSQCGASTLLPSSGETAVCEGAAMVPGAADAPRTSLNPRVLYAFNGAESGALVYAGVRAGWATVADPSLRKSELESKRVQVVREGKKGCPSTGPANLDNRPGLNSYELSMCKNYSWVLPTAQRISNITVSNGNLWYEKGTGDEGVLLYAMSQGKTTVVVEFKGELAEPLVLDVIVDPCK